MHRSRGARRVAGLTGNTGKRGKENSPMTAWNVRAPLHDSQKPAGWLEPFGNVWLPSGRNSRLWAFQSLAIVPERLIPPFDIITAAVGLS